MNTRKRQLTVILVCLAAAILSLVAAFTLTSVPRVKAESVYIPDIENTVLTSAEDENAEIGKPSEQENDVQPYSADIFRERKIVDSGKPDSESIVLTFMGDGFTENEQGLFIEKVTQAVNYLIGTAEKSGCYPFSLFADYFTVYAIEVISNESGVSRDCNANEDGTHENIMVDNYFGSSFYGGNDYKGIARATVISEEEKARSLAKPNSFATVVLCNSGREGGAANGSLIVMTLYKTELKPEEMENTLVHELGHVCGLEDEYYMVADNYFRKKEAPNCSKDPNKWAQWNCPDLEICSYADDADYSDVRDPDNVKPDPESEKWYKPSLECMMKDTIYEFCPVCTEAIISALGEILGKSLFEIETSSDGQEIWIKKLNLNAVNAFKIPSYINGKPVTRIEEYAFAEQTRCTAINLPTEIKRIDAFAFRGCSAVRNELVIHNSLTYIGNGAFYGCNKVRFSVLKSHPHFSYENDMLSDKENKTIIAANSATPGNSITKPVAPYAFAGNEYITDLTFESCTEIGDYAFADCPNLSAIDFETTEVPTVGNNVFENCVPELVVYVPYKYQSNFKSAFGADADRVQSRQLNVSLHSDYNVENIPVYVGADIDIFYTPEKTGYVFDGWYDNPEFNGNAYTNNGVWQKDDNTTYYAKWTPKTYTVTLDPDGGILTGSDTFTVTYGSVFSTETTVSKDYHVFHGWFLGTERYITENGVGTVKWDIDGDVTLKAVWTPYSYEVKIDAGTWKWLGEYGVSEHECLIEYGTTIPNDQVFDYFRNMEKYDYLGRYFSHFTDVNGTILAWETIPALGANGETVVIVPHWEKEVYNIKFETKCDLVVEAQKHIYGEEITLPVLSRAGYIFLGWSTEVDGIAREYVTVPDLTPNAQSVEAEVSLYAQWTPITYNIVYHTNGGTGSMADTSCEYGTTYNLRTNTFTRTGYTFAGWATTESSPVKYVDERSVDNLTTENGGTVDLYAKWTPITYTVVYNPNGGTGSMANTSCRYDTAYNLRTNTFGKKGNTFVGWSKSPSGSVEYFNGQEIRNLTSVGGEEINLYAVWNEIKYDIVYKNLADGMKVNKLYYTYEEGIPVMPKLYTRGSNGRDIEFKTFLGWYTSLDFSQQIKSIPEKSRTGVLTLYAKYEYFLLKQYDNGQTYKVSGSGSFGNPCFDVDIYLGSLYYNKVKDTSLKKIRIDFSLSYTGYYGKKEIALYDSDFAFSPVWKTSIYKYGSGVYHDSIELDLEKYKNIDIFKLRFESDFGGSWQFSDFEFTVNLTN